MNRSESKFSNTSKKMNEALFKLLEIKDFTEISISEICNLANVNRSTFYSHYDNTLDLLKETHSNFMKEFFSIFSKGLDDLDFSSIKVEEFISERFLLPYLKFIKKNKRLFKVYMENLTTFNTDDSYNQLLERVWIPACKQKGLNDYTIINYMSKYYLSGMTAIINEWINNNCEDDIILICEIIILCVRPEKDSKSIKLI